MNILFITYKDIYLLLFTFLSHLSKRIKAIFLAYLYSYYKTFYNKDPDDLRVTPMSVLKKKELNYLYLIIILLITIYTNVLMFEEDILISHSIFPLIMPLNLKLLINKYANFRQNLFNKITLKLLQIPIINVVVKLWHRFLFAFRYYSVFLGDYISQYVSMNMVALITSIIFSRLDLAGYLIIFCLLFLRLDFGVLAIARFYKQYPHKLQELYSNQKRHMWSQAAKIAQEVASNPYVQSAAVMTSGAVAWKALDVYDTYKESLMQDKDIAAENERNIQNINAENKRHEEEMAMRNKELEETRQARLDENKRHEEEMAMRKAEMQK